MSYSPVPDSDDPGSESIRLRPLQSGLLHAPTSPDDLRRAHSPSPRHVRPPGYADDASSSDEDDEEILQLIKDEDARAARGRGGEGEGGAGGVGGPAGGVHDLEEALYKEEDLDSAISIVRKVVPESDDPSLPALTARVLILGTILCIFGASVSQIFFFKSNAPSFSSFFIILLSYPLGKLSDRVLPDWLNPGPFGKKEHMLIAILAGSGANAAYAGEIVAVQSLYYHSDLGTFGGLLLLISTQLIGFGLSGMTYKLLVCPTVMVWPSQLVTVALYETLHGGAKEHQQQTRDRMRFFLLAFVAIFVWQFLPSVIFPTLTSIATLCIIDNSSWVMRTLGSGYDGFGYLNFSLDWSVIGGTGALYTPFFAQCSYFAGLALNLWVVVPVLYFLVNFWNAQSYDSPLAARLDVLEILNDDLSLNEARYAEIGPLRLTPYFAITYGVSFAMLTSAVTTVALWYSNDIRAALWAKKDAVGDIHVEMLERSYAPVPKMYYLSIFVANLAAAVVLLVFYPLQLPVWGLFLAMLIAVAFLVPVGIISAITNTTLGLNVITEFVAGWIWPGKPIANIVFKVYGYMAMLQSIELTSDLKLGLYMKVPPRALFLCQAYGTALGSVVNFLLIQGVIAAKRPYLDGTVVDPTQQWSGRKPEIFFSASVIFGLISPSKFFTGEYRVLYWGFLIGAILPIIPWIMYKRTGKKIWKQINVPLVLHGSIAPPQTPMNVLLPGFIVSWLSQYWALRYRPRWFEKYCYVLSSALDAGTSIQALAVYILGIGTFWTWWGNSAVDAEHCTPGS
ncbi:hypothetical protein Rhopal_003379-T1 [Rhodotorula paludigena]|uniref:OPT family small oligopeptide transporter n=1 Tax=Rhodotorula paludigena TaxID=86838 RepID=A0AAV5GNU7_9BASI|nr:hypothetical protein Rhopal_003379-T1 [Rhodotorula paludigena]